jgi:tetratricopeptide (TPR) repeat protein
MEHDAGFSFPHRRAGVRLPGRPLCRARRVWAMAVALSAAISAALIVPGWLAVLPRPVRRALTEILLESVLAVYVALLFAAVIGTVILGGVLARSWHAGHARPPAATYFLASASCLVALGLLELASAAWGAWMHRFPTLPTQFAVAPSDPYRIIVIGGSSAAGEPYWPWLSVGQIVAWQLSRGVSDRKFECEILAYPGDSLEMQHHKLAMLTRRPDAIIIYAGHNEFAARFEEEREGWQDERPWTPLARLNHHACMSSPFCSLVYQIISKNRLDRPPSLALRHQPIDPPVCSELEATAILNDFQRRTEAIVAYCDRIGVLPILIVPPANEAGYEPGRSTVAAAVPADERLRLVHSFQLARAIERHDPLQSAAAYGAILERHPTFAEAHFRLGRVQERQGRFALAGQHYLAALDHDGLPLRCQASFRSAIAEVAYRHRGSILIDGPNELRAISPNGLLGDTLIHDTHHPTLRGHIALAGAILRELDRREIFPHTAALESPVDPAVCADHFKMNTARWIDLCERVSEHYRRVAGYRYDPAERLEKAARYKAAAENIRRGLPIDDPELAGALRGYQANAGLLAPSVSVPWPAAAGQPGHASIGIDLAYPRDSFDDLFDLPILQIDHGATTQKTHHADKLVALPATNNLARHAGQGSGRDPDRGADGHGVFFRHGQARAQHEMNLAEITFEGRLVDDVEHAYQPVGAKRGQAGARISLEKDISRKEWNN